MKRFKYKLFEYDPNMTAAKYADERISYNIQRCWHKCKLCRRLYLYTNLFGIILSSAVPILVNINNIGKLCPTIVSFVVVILVSIDKVFHLKDRWKNYQNCQEALSRELYLFETNNGQYHSSSSEEKFVILVSTVENIIKLERENTITVHTSEIKVDAKHSV